MQIQYTIELRIDVPDEKLREPIHKAVAKSVVRLNAHAQVAAQCTGHQVKPKIAYWSDDFFNKPEELTLQDALRISQEDDAALPQVEEVRVSQELLDAFKPSEG
jgi:hypothetical protein